MTALRDFLRVSKPGLTIRPSEYMIGFQENDFARYLVGNGKLEMEEDKIDKIKNASQPKPKKQVRSFLGLTCFISCILQFHCFSITF